MFKMKRFDELFKVGSAKRVLKSQWKEEGVPFYRGREVTKLSMNGSVDNQLFITKTHFEELKKKHGVPKVGDIIMTAIGTIGNAYIVKSNDEFYFKDASVLWLNRTSSVLSKYVDYFIKSDLFKSQLDVGNGATVDTLTIKKLSSIEIMVPSIEEQQRIVAKLDVAFAKIDKHIANISKTENQLTFLTKNYLKKIINEKKYQWKHKTLSEISINLDNKRIPITKSKRNQGKIPYYGASGIVDYVSDWIFDDDLLLISEDGANLLMRTYPIAFSVYGKCWVNNHAHVLKFKNKMLQNWVETYLNSINLSDYISGMAQPKLNQTKLNEIKIPVPREDLLEDLISKLKSFKENCELFQSQTVKKMSLIKSLKTSILKQELNKAA